MQRHSFNLCRSFARAGVQVDLYHCDPEKRGASSLDCFTPEEKAMISAQLIEFPKFGKMPGHYIRESYEYSVRIAKSLKKKARPDFIYAKGFTAWHLLHLKSKGEQLPPIGVNLHGYEMFQQQPGFLAKLQAQLFLKSPAQFAVKHADYLFSYGGKITDLIRSLGVAPERIISIPGGIGAEWLARDAAPPQQPLRFLFVGRVERRKGLEELNAALKELMATEKDKIAFSFAGPIQPSQRVKGCTYHGEVKDQKELMRIYAANDVLVVPSHSEGMPNVILEGMAAGMAIAATDVGAVRALVDDANGWIIAAPTPAAIKDTLQTILRTAPAEVLQRKKTSLTRVRSSFTWEQIGARTLEVVSGLMT